MNHQVKQISVLPLYGQVSVHAPGTIDLPEWATGEEPSVASEHALVIATRSDMEGDVTISVTEGQGDEPGVMVFDSEVSFPGRVLEVGSIVGGALTQIPLARSGYVHLRVYVDAPGAASHVNVVLEPGTVAR